VKTDEGAEAETEEDLEPFVPPRNFDIPIDMEVPDTMKLHAIIEKTARFIAGQGAQMEILLKAKQANNRQFDFLNQDCKYFNYYRHVLSAMKNNCYPVTEEPAEPKESKKKKGKSGDAGAQSAAPEKPAVVVPQIRYKPSKDCSYTQLISKITGAPIPVQPAKSPSPPAVEPR
jgi:Surp module